MHADSHFVIGSEHPRKGQPCQDYAAGESLPNGGAFAIVSDGCSTGGNTDNGSRVIVLSTVQAIREHWNTTARIPAEDETDWITVRQRVVATSGRSVLGLGSRDMYATCVYAYASPDEGFGFVHGDGAIVWMYPDGRMGMCRYEWDKNTPVYPAYAIDAYKEFIELHGGDVTAEKVTEEYWEQSAPNGSFVLLASNRRTLGDGIRGFYVQMPEGVRFFGVVTDGIFSVQGKTWEEVLDNIFDIKGVKGSFVKRQLIWLVREGAENDQVPADDLACALIDLQGKGKS